MRNLNYHHLHTFAAVARAGTLAAASRELGIGRPAISMQLAQLESAVGAPLFDRAGRGRELTETGRLVRGYAEEIFALGRELEDSLRGDRHEAVPPLRVGLADSIAKSAAARLLLPALEVDPPARLVVREGDMTELLDELARHRLELVLTDQELAPGTTGRSRTHRLGSCPVVLMGTPALVARFKPGFPSSLDAAPILLPGPSSVVRREVLRWLAERDLRPRIVGEFDDSAMMKMFGEGGAGLFPVPTVAEHDVRRLYGARRVGQLTGVEDAFFAFSNPRFVPHPGVEAIVAEGHGRLHG